MSLILILFLWAILYSESVMELAYEHHVPAIDFQLLKLFPESEQFFLSQITR